MPPIAWLAIAVAAGVGAYLAAWPAWRDSRARAARDTNTERYLRWRGRAPREQRPRAGMTPDERRRWVIGAILGGVSVVALFAFLAGG